MAGLKMSCGTFRGRDKSASALFGVFKELREAPAEIIGPFLQIFKTTDHAFIAEDHAKLLLPSLMDYHRRLVADIGDDDWAREANAEERAGLDPGKAQWGEGRGWRLYCTVDLIKACNTATLENQPILICFA